MSSFLYREDAGNCKPRQALSHSEKHIAHSSVVSVPLSLDDFPEMKRKIGTMNNGIAGKLY